MKYRTNILRLGMVTTLSVLLAAPLAGLANAATTNYNFALSKDVYITEVQTSSLKSAGEEFVELFNNTGADIDLADTAHAGKDAWKLQYFAKTKLSTLLPASTSASGWTSPYRTISLSGVIHAGDYYVLASEGYVPGSIDPDQTYTSTLADDGGALQLLDVVTQGTTTTYGVHDRLAWSNDTTLAVNPLLFAAPGAGASLQRLPNDNDEYLNSDGTLTSFTVGSTISPKNAWQAPVPVDPPTPISDPTSGDTGTDPTTPADPTTPVTPAAPNANVGLTAPQITELLPNPASPATDEIDEYIELYNPNDAAFNLNGYTLETGTTTLHDFTFTDDVLLQPGEYRAFYSVETKLSLSNTGGQARLLDPAQIVLSQTGSYNTAADGMAWALDSSDGTWKWTSAATPGNENLIITPAVAVKAVKATKATATSAKKSTAKVKGTSTTKTKTAAKTKKAKITATAAATTTPARPPAHIHFMALAAVAALGVAYMVYEYRHDLGNRFAQFRANRTTRSKVGK